MSDHLTLLVTAITGVGPIPATPDIYQVHLEARQPPVGASLNLTLEFHTTQASTLLSLMQGKPPKLADPQPVKI